MALKVSGSYSLASLSQVPPSAPSCLSPLAPHGQNLPLTSFSSFLSMLPMPPLYPQIPHTSCLTKRPLFSETLPIPPCSELVRTCSFKIKPSEDTEAKPLICYTP